MKKPAATAAERLEETRTAHAETGSRITALEAARITALMADDDREVDRLDSEILRLRKQSRVHTDKIALLRDQVAREHREQGDREREAEIKKIEQIFLEREAVGAELADLIVQTNKSFLRLLRLGRDLDGRWQWEGGDRHALLIHREELVNRIQHEIFRSTCVPNMLGGQTPHPDQGSFPGALAPRIELLHLPEKVKPFLEVLRETSNYASDVMRGRRAAAPAAPAQQKSSALDFSTPGTFTPTELSALLERQHELAALDNPSPAQEVEYGEVIKQIAMLQTETTANAQR